MIRRPVQRESPMPSPLPLLLAATLALAACGPRGGISFDPDAAAVGTVETVIVASARQSVEGQPIFSRARTETPIFARFEVSVPPERTPGSVTFPDALPIDPTTDFVTTEAVRLSGEAAFVAAMDAQIAGDPASAGRAAIFVHGFNTTFGEGVYRQAQLQHDYDTHGAAVHFAWPSAGSAEDYLYDRESALFARGPLETTLAAMARSRASDINVIAHSMGAFLTMETLAIMARTGHDAFFERVNAVLLLSPDIEIDVFRTQARPVLARGVPIIVIVSTRDRALLASALIRGERDRLGSIRSADELGGLDVTLVDISTVDAGGGLGHFAVARSPELIELLRGFREQGLDLIGTERRPGVIEGSAALIQQGTDIFLRPFSP
jgi:esterase/lipase superfamily enzyme